MWSWSKTVIMIVEDRIMERIINFELFLTKNCILRLLPLYLSCKAPKQDGEEGEDEVILIFLD